MKTSHVAFLGAAVLALALPGSLFAAKVTSDLTPPQKRQAAVDIAEQLAQRKAPAALPAEIPSPFHPTDFEKPDPSEMKANPQRPGSAPAPGPAAPAQPAAPVGDRAVLETLAAQINPSGMFQLGGKPLLIIKNNRFEVGTRFTATYQNQDYELELVAIDRTTFTLRYRNEEITRPIKSSLTK